MALPADDERGAGHAVVNLRHDEELRLELAGDLGEQNAGMLIFGDDRERPEYVAWSEVVRIDFDQPRAMVHTLRTALETRCQPAVGTGGCR